MLALLLSLSFAGWQDEAAATSAAVAAAEPELVEQVAAWQPVTTRSGHRRFVGDYSRDPRLTPLLLHRLATGEDSEAVRVALVEAIARQRGAGHAEALPELALNAAQPMVRAMAVESLRALDGDVSVTLAAALADPVSNVREAAARIAGRVGARSLVPDLSAALADPSPAVRASAARSLGNLRQPEAFEALLPLLDDDDGQVRLEALHALERVAPEEAPELSQLSGLVDDPDRRVARAAAALIR